MDKQSIILLSCGHFEKEITQPIANDIASQFGSQVIIKEIPIDLSAYYNPARRQYDANQILKFISESTPSSPIKAIGLLRVDLFIPILTYIFGQAFLNGNYGIVSLYRLRNELYGLETNNPLLIERFRKVIIHELGHMHGLIHCQNSTCVMRSSTYVEDIDQKGIHFCPQCQVNLNRNDC